MLAYAGFPGARLLLAWLLTLSLCAGARADEFAPSEQPTLRLEPPERACRVEQSGAQRAAELQTLKYDFAERASLRLEALYVRCAWLHTALAGQVDPGAPEFWIQLLSWKQEGGPWSTGRRRAALSKTEQTLRAMIAPGGEVQNGLDSAWHARAEYGLKLAAEKIIGGSYDGGPLGVYRQNDVAVHVVGVESRTFAGKRVAYVSDLAITFIGERGVALFYYTRLDQLTLSSKLAASEGMIAQLLSEADPPLPTWKRLLGDIDDVIRSITIAAMVTAFALWRRRRKRDAQNACRN